MRKARGRYFYEIFAMFTESWGIPQCRCHRERSVAISHRCRYRLLSEIPTIGANASLGIFSVGQKRADNCEGIRVVNCLFKIHDPQLGEKDAPVYIKGIVKDIRFIGCRFEAEGFDTEEHSRNGVLFYFTSRLAFANYTYNTMHWVFDRCQFINTGTTSVNSVILSDSYVDGWNTVFCQVKNCIIEGFRWTIRIAKTDDLAVSSRSRKYNYSGKINPYFFENPTDDPMITQTEQQIIDESTTALQNLTRFTCKNNFYHILSSLGNGSYYKPAEEFGS